MDEVVDSGEGLKSQRPKRRKHAEHVARAGMGEASACHPKRARVSALFSMYCGALVVDLVRVLLADSVADE